MYIGRLPVRSPSEINLLIAKIMQFESSAPAGGALLVSDIGDTSDFKAANLAVKEILSKWMPVEEIVRGSNEYVLLQKRLIDAINAGTKIVNYMGHGSVDIWRANFFTSSDARALTNAGNIPLCCRHLPERILHQPGHRVPGRVAASRGAWRSRCRMDVHGGEQRGRTGGSQPEVL